MKIEFVIFDIIKDGIFTFKFGDKDDLWDTRLTYTTNEIIDKHILFPIMTENNLNLINAYITFCRRMKYNEK